MTAPAPALISRAFAMPILIDMGMGKSIADIAHQRCMSEELVVATLEHHGPEWLASQVRATWPMTRPRGEKKSREERDWAYANWQRARIEARRLLMTWDFDQ